MFKKKIINNLKFFLSSKYTSHIFGRSFKNAVYNIYETFMKISHVGIYITYIKDIWVRAIEVNHLSPITPKSMAILLKIAPQQLIIIKTILQKGIASLLQPIYRRKEHLSMAYFTKHKLGRHDCSVKKAELPLGRLTGYLYGIQVAGLQVKMAG